MKEVGSRYKIPKDNTMGYIVDVFTTEYNERTYQIQWEDDIIGHVYDYTDDDLECYEYVPSDEEKAIETIPNFSFV